MYFEPIPDHATPRKCCVCMKPATLHGYLRAKAGGLDYSSRQHFCETHSTLFAEPTSPSVATVQ